MKKCLSSAVLQWSRANKICKFYSELKEDGFRTLAFIGLSQNLPESTPSEFKSLVDQAVVTVSECCKKDHHEDCNKDPVGRHMFQREVCASQSVAEKNGLKHCCELTAASRTQCFVDHKSKILVNVSHEPDVSAQVLCKEYKEDEKKHLGEFIYYFSRQHVMLQPQIIVGIMHGYNEILKSCCHEKDVQSCFDEKKNLFKQKTEERVTELMSLCLIQEKYGDRIIKAKKNIQYSQTIPQASYAQIESFKNRVSTLTKTCCSGNMIACMRERKELVDELCGNHALVSQCEHLSECCKKSVVERGSCVQNMKVKKLAGLSEHYEVHEHLAETCKTFKDTPDKALGKILYEISRRHPEASQQAILRHMMKIQESLHQCCNKADVGTCFKTAMGKSTLEQKIEDDTKYYSNLCATDKEMGHEGLEKRLLAVSTSIMPQASFDVVNTIAEDLADVISPCCKEESKHRLLPCAENKVTNIIDVTCHKIKPETINPEIAHCCNDSYSMRRICINSLKPNTAFQPPLLTTQTFHMGPELCTNDANKLLLASKRLLYSLVQQKTTIKPEQLKTIATKFNELRNKCCAEADKAACFSTEGPKLVTESETLLKA
uniref:Serum albumin 2-like n=1 Tax=Scleropages formosus TaxID=113540 RepID=A0A8C9VL29_SCLFO